MPMYLFSITNNEEISLAVHRIFSEQYDFIISACNNREDHHKSIHDIRRASKRIRAILRLIKPDIPNDIYRKENTLIRDLSRKFSTARNLHVFVTDFANILNSGILQLPEQEANAVKAFLKEIEEKALKLLLDHDIFTVVSNIAKVSKERIAILDFSSLGPHTIHKGVSKVFSRGQKQMLHTQQFPTDENLHEMRKRIKTLMYLVKLIKDTSPEFFNGYFKGLKSTSKALGNDHNMAELADFINLLNNQLISCEGKEKLNSYISSQRQQIQLEEWAQIAKLYTGQADEFSQRVKSYWLLGRQG